jgi:ribonuclease T1
MRRAARATLAALVLATALPACNAGSTEVSTCDLPAEGRHTLTMIRQGGPFPYRKDGSIFQNFERQLADRETGYYREYTVRTPGLNHRGARRIVAGSGAIGDVRRSEEYYYTADHYRSFRRIRESAACPTKRPSSSD